MRGGFNFFILKTVLTHWKTSFGEVSHCWARNGLFESHQGSSIAITLSISKVIEAHRSTRKDDGGMCSSIELFCNSVGVGIHENASYFLSKIILEPINNISVYYNNWFLFSEVFQINYQLLIRLVPLYILTYWRIWEKKSRESNRYIIQTLTNHS